MCECSLCTVPNHVYACVRCVICVQVQDMYFANPPVAPSLTFYKDVFQTLVKFDDRCVLQKSLPPLMHSPSQQASCATQLTSCVELVGGLLFVLLY